MNSEEESKHQDYIKKQKELLGASTWTFLHAVAATFPKKPSIQQQLDAKKLIELVGQFYPCKECREDFKESIRRTPPVTRSREEFSIYLCERHNEVNAKLGKSTVDCKRMWKLWQAKHSELDETKEETTQPAVTSTQRSQATAPAHTGRTSTKTPTTQESSKAGNADDENDEDCSYCANTFGSERAKQMKRVLTNLKYGDSKT